MEFYNRANLSSEFCDCVVQKNFLNSYCRQLSLEIQKATLHRQQEEEAWYRQQQLLLDAEEKRRKLIKEEEGKLTMQRRRYAGVSIVMRDIIWVSGNWLGDQQGRRKIYKAAVLRYVFGNVVMTDIA